MKEAAYKAWSTMGGPLLDHHDVQLTVTGDAFTAEISTDAVFLHGVSMRVADRWLSLVVARCAPTGDRSGRRQCRAAAKAATQQSEVLTAGDCRITEGEHSVRTR